MSNKKENWIQALKFLLFSISAGVIQVVLFATLEIIGLNYWICYLTSLIASIIWNFTLNRSFTFKSANNVPIAMLKVALYYVIFTPLSTWGGNALEAIGWNAYLVLAISMITNFVTEFLYSKYFTFRNSINTNKRAKKEMADKEGQKEINEKETQNNNESK